MKEAIVFFVLVTGFVRISAQSFHFEDSSTTIIKTTAQSPAHWYIEIYNDINAKDTLRWKAHFSNVPAPWSISFDVQSGYFNPVADGDSSDFVLLDSLDFPQKLIIGAETNNTPGHAFVFFDIYDPNDPGSLVTIQYEFIITGPDAGMEEQELPFSVSIYNKTLYVNSHTPVQLTLADLKGSAVRNCSHCSQLDVSGLTSGIYLVSVQTAGTIHTKKIFIEP